MSGAKARAAGACLFAFLACAGAQAQTAAVPREPLEVGVWQTISDKTGKPEGYVRIWREGDELRGKIERGMPGDDPNDLCTACPGELKNQRKIGMTIITGLRKGGADGWWEGGKVLDPDEGRFYRCKMRAIEGGQKLEMRGYLGISLLGRTQTWLRAE